jgi:squalene-hopene/tetraprenyl-beta-curcumene cyclase
MHLLSKFGWGLGLLLPQIALATPSESNLRISAQRGLDYLGSNTISWQQQNKCYGCHVQAVTLDGLAVGKNHQYNVPDEVMNGVVDGILKLPGGSRTPEGLSHPSFPRTAKTFGAEAFARYDAMVDNHLADDLIRVSRDLLKFQNKDGSVQGDHVGPPVTTGVMQATFQATQAWRQSYAHTADAMWLTPLQSAEQYIARTVRTWEGNPKGVYLQDVNYAVMGMLATGVNASEGELVKLIQYLQKRQNQDGGWGFVEGHSDPYATGQTVYTLRLAGLTEQDDSVSKGLSWLVEHQSQDGSWGRSGSTRAEAMWGVLGLVSVDVLSVAVHGIGDGEHVRPTEQISVEAKDNQGQSVKKIELRIDDLSVKSADGAKLSFDWDTSKLKDGAHTIDAIATNAEGHTSRRRVEIFAGNVFLTQLGTRFTDGGTQVTLRNIVPEGRKGSVALRVFADEGDAKKKAEPVFSDQRDSVHGPMTFFFAGKDKQGKPCSPGRYRAELAFLDESGKELQREETVFVHDSLEVQSSKYAEVEGQVSFDHDGAKGSSANADVELVNERGEVVQRTRSNEAGQYRFKGVSQGKYKVRMAKDGFQAGAAAPVEATPAAAPAKVDMTLR